MRHYVYLVYDALDMLILGKEGYVDFERDAYICINRNLRENRDFVNFFRSSLNDVGIKNEKHQNAILDELLDSPSKYIKIIKEDVSVCNSIYKDNANLDNNKMPVTFKIHFECDIKNLVANCSNIITTKSTQKYNEAINAAVKALNGDNKLHNEALALLKELDDKLQNDIASIMVETNPYQPKNKESEEKRRIVVFGIWWKLEDETRDVYAPKRVVIENPTQEMIDELKEGLYCSAIENYLTDMYGFDVIKFSAEFES